MGKVGEGEEFWGEGQGLFRKCSLPSPQAPLPVPFKLAGEVGAKGPDFPGLNLNLRNWGWGLGGVFCKS